MSRRRGKKKEKNTTRPRGSEPICAGQGNGEEGTVAGRTGEKEPQPEENLQKRLRVSASSEDKRPKKRGREFGKLPKKRGNFCGMGPPETPTRHKQKNCGGQQRLFPREGSRAPEHWGRLSKDLLMRSLMEQTKARTGPGIKPDSLEVEGGRPNSKVPFWTGLYWEGSEEMRRRRVIRETSFEL